MKLNLSLLTKFSKICLYLILFLLVYSILHFIFPSLVIFSIPFWSWGIFQTLATLSIGFGIDHNSSEMSNKATISFENASWIKVSCSVRSSETASS